MAGSLEGYALETNNLEIVGFFTRLGYGSWRRDRWSVPGWCSELDSVWRSVVGLESASAQLSGPARLGNTTTSLHGNGVRVELEYATVDLWYILLGAEGVKS